MASSLIAMDEPDAGNAPPAAAAGQQLQLPPKRDRRVLELGAGTGQLSMDLAMEGWRGIIATDGEPAVVKNMRYNIQSNRCGHAVRCLKWDWKSPPPKGVNLADIDLCFGSDLVYYNRKHADLAALLYTVLSSREATEDRPAIRALLLLTLRKPKDDGNGIVVHEECGDGGYEGSCVQNFLEGELPAAGLVARRLVIPQPALDGSDALDPTCFRLYDVHLTA